MATVAVFDHAPVGLYWGPGKYALADESFAAVHDAAHDWLKLGQATFAKATQGLGGYDPSTVLFVWKGFQGDRHIRATPEQLDSPTHPLYGFYKSALLVIKELQEHSPDLR